MAWYRAGGGGIPSSLKTGMNSVLNKKFGTSTTYDPVGWPDNVNLLGPLPEKTASGSVANITDGADGVPIKAWKVTLPASLSGYSAINGTQNTGTGTPETQYTVSLGRTIYGGSVDVVNGTGTDGAQKIKIGDLDWTYQSANTRFYTASLTSAIAKPSTNGELAPFLYSDVLSPLSFTAAQNVDKSICVATSGNIFVKDTTYTDKTTFLQHYGDTYIIVGKATPEDFTFSPITPTPETALGVNNFWADEGDSDVTYRADIDLLLGGN